MSMVIEELKKNGVNMETVMRRFMGKEDLYLKFLKRFLEDDSFQKMDKYLEEDNVEEAFKAAHTLKGVVTNLGLDDIMVSAIPITEVLRAGSLEEAKNMREKVRTEYETVVKILTM